jgi:hypothetical protein
VHESDVDSAINALVINAVVPNSELRPQIEIILEKRQKAAIMAGECDRAAEQDSILRLLQTTIQMAEHGRNEDSSTDRLYPRRKQLERLQQEITEKWEVNICELMAKNDEEQSMLQTQQSQAIEHFIAKWKDPAFLRPFTRPSPKLLMLREQEHQMGLSRNYAQAKETKAIADKLQRDEMQAAQGRINAMMIEERQKLSAKHEMELKALAIKRDQVAQSAREQTQKELRPVLAALWQIEAKKVTPIRNPSSLPIFDRPESA